MRGVKSFLRHAGFYRRFIWDFSKVTRLLCKLLEKDATFDEACLDAFNELKYRLITAPIMIVSNWTKPFEIMFDASDYEIEAMLGQRH